MPKNGTSYTNVFKSCLPFSAGDLERAESGRISVLELAKILELLLGSRIKNALFGELKEKGYWATEQSWVDLEELEMSLVAILGSTGKEIATEIRAKAKK